MAYDDAVATLYQSSQAQFVAERKRLAAELKASGDKAGAAQLGKLARPTLSAWAVNQLWWHAREGFEALLASSARLREGDRSATAAHRDALLLLRGRAAVLLTDAGHAVTDATLRRVTTTLTALAATGSFSPDAPGALASDRDPPGFEALGSVTNWSTGAPASGAAEAAREAVAPAALGFESVAPSNDGEAEAAPKAAVEAADVERPLAAQRGALREAARAKLEQPEGAAEAAAREGKERRRAEAEAAEVAARAETERRRAEAEAAARAEAERRREQERARRLAARAELEGALTRARAELATGEREAARLRAELAGAEGRVARARTALREIEARWAAFGAVE
jgi:hypothetical protein